MKHTVRYEENAGEERAWYIYGPEGRLHCETWFDEEKARDRANELSRGSAGQEAKQ